MRRGNGVSADVVGARGQQVGEPLDRLRAGQHAEQRVLPGEHHGQRQQGDEHLEGDRQHPRQAHTACQRPHTALEGQQERGVQDPLRRLDQGEQGPRRHHRGGEAAQRQLYYARS